MQRGPEASPPVSRVHGTGDAQPGACPEFYFSAEMNSVCCHDRATRFDNSLRRSVERGRGNRGVATSLFTGTREREKEGLLPLPQPTLYLSAPGVEAVRL